MLKGSTTGVAPAKPVIASAKPGIALGSTTGVAPACGKPVRVTAAVDSGVPASAYVRIRPHTSTLLESFAPLPRRSPLDVHIHDDGVTQ